MLRPSVFLPDQSQPGGNINNWMKSETSCSNLVPPKTMEKKEFYEQ